MQLIINLIDRLIPYGSFAYLIMFGILLACGFGLPLPEDIILVTGGILAARHITDFWVVVLVCMIGVLMGDGIIFTIGHRMGPRLKETRLYKHLLNKQREKKVGTWFTKYGDKVIFFARFAPGLRAPLFLTAGIYQVSYLKFFLLDGMAALISVPAWIWVGFIFGSNLEILERKIRTFQYGIYFLLGSVLAFILGSWLVKRKLNAANDEE